MLQVFSEMERRAKEQQGEWGGKGANLEYQRDRCWSGRTFREWSPSELADTITMTVTITMSVTIAITVTIIVMIGVGVRGRGESGVRVS
jgi:hypothetical protein